jgi:hypothetical protein
VCGARSRRLVRFEPKEVIGSFITRASRVAGLVWLSSGRRRANFRDPDPIRKGAHQRRRDALPMRNRPVTLGRLIATSRGDSMDSISGRRVLLSVVTLLFSSFGHAASQRSFVSSSGVDNPICSLAMPCRSFASAIASILSGGEVIVLDSAGYGPVTITKSASIIAPSGVYAGVSVFTGNGITVNGAGVSVVLRGLAINGLGGDAGIVIVDAARVRIEHCVVSGMSHMGIFHAAAFSRVTMSDTIVRDNTDEGIRFVTGQGASITLERVTSEGNHDGLYVSPTVSNGSLHATISDSSFSGNSRYGIWADAGANARITASIDRTTLADNGPDGILATGSSSATLRVTVQRSTLRRNGIGILAVGSSPATVEVNASDNVLHQNIVLGIIASGTGATVRASGNSYDVIGCEMGGSILSYTNNSVTGMNPGCAAPASLL